MKKSNLLVPITCLTVILYSCNQNEAKKKEETPIVEPPKAMESGQPLFPMGNQGPEAYFTGTSYVQGFLPKDSVQNNYSIGEVIFEPSARSNWHDHPAGQVLLITSGNGFVQEKGKPARAIKKGDVVVCQPDMEHWHGAAPDSKMSHIAITHYKADVNVNWKQAVTDEEYENAVQ